MGKKRTLAIILLLCVLGGLIVCGRKEKEDEYTYTIKLNDNASGSKQFSSCGLVLCQDLVQVKMRNFFPF